MNPSLFETLAQSRIVRDYEEAFSAATGFVMKLQPAIGAADLSPIVAHANPFCCLMTCSPQAREVCNKTFAAIRNQVAGRAEPAQACCIAGFTHIAVPVLAAGEHVATIYGGQLMLSKPTRRGFDTLSRQLVRLGLGDRLSELEQAWFQTPVVSDKQLQAILYLLQSFAIRISQHAATLLLEPVDDEPAEMTRAREFIRERFADPINLRDAASLVQVSEFSLGRLFKRSVGLTFLQYLTLYRVEHAKGMLASIATEIAAIASQSGFASISQFNRSFRQCAGMNPTQYRSMLQGGDSLLAAQGGAHSDAP